jgi:hypothetical protein
VSFAIITLCVASQGVFIVVVFVYFVIDSVKITFMMRIRAVIDQLV